MIERQSGRRAKFVDLSEFLSERSRLANSIFGRETFSVKARPRKERSYTVTASERERKKEVTAPVLELVEAQSNIPVLKCYYCGKDHKLTDCKKFKEKKYEERVEFVRSKVLCFKCLGGKHTARECKSRKKCTVAGCTGTLHHALLHRPQQKLQPVKSSTSETSNSSSIQTSAVGKDKWPF